MLLAIQNLDEIACIVEGEDGMVEGSSTAMVSDRSEVDTARPFRSVKEAVAVFGERILVGDGRPKSNGGVVASNGSAITIGASSVIREDSSSRSVAIAEQEIEVEGEATPAVVPMYSAPSSPPSFTSSRSPELEEDIDEEGVHGGGLAVVRGIKKLEAEVAETRQEVVKLRKRGAEMEMAVASLNAQLHRGLSKLAEMEADRAAAAAQRSIGGDTDVTATARSERWWGERSGSYGEYLPSFSYALSLGELDDELDGGGGRRRKAQKVKPIVPLIGDIIFSKRKSTKDKGSDGFFSGDLYSVLD